MRQKSFRGFALAALVSLPLGALVVAACVSDSLGNKGAACSRASDCVGGLFCVDSVCTDDLSKLDGGTVSNFTDSGMAAEANADATDAATDAPPGETPPPVDTGMPPVDTGMPPVDTGMPPVDTGTPPPVDTGTPPDDTGTAPDDTGTAD